MFQKDYLMRQIQQMVQVITQVLFHRKNDELEQALDIIDQSLQEIPGLDEFLRPDLNRDEVIAACTGDDGSFNAEKAVVVADVLREKGEILEEGATGDDEVDAAQGADRSGTVWLRYAMWLYESALEKGGSAVPWDIHGKIARLREQVNGAR